MDEWDEQSFYGIVHDEKTESFHRFAGDRFRHKILFSNSKVANCEQNSNDFERSTHIAAYAARSTSRMKLAIFVPKDILEGKEATIAVDY